jgi:archaellum component FlaC
MSPKNREAQEYFSLVIKKELAQVEKENTPATKKLVSDALLRLDRLEKDYNTLADELQQKGESKKIIHAMITNLQTRISFLEEVLTQIENIKKIKENYHENNT